MPTSRVEYALRGDELLTDTDVRELMQVYITVRSRRMRPGAPGHDVGRAESNGDGASAAEVRSRS